jgi:hypothetical protein
MRVGGTRLQLLGGPRFSSKVINVHQLSPPLAFEKISDFEVIVGPLCQSLWIQCTRFSHVRQLNSVHRPYVRTSAQVLGLCGGHKLSASRTAAAHGITDACSLVDCLHVSLSRLSDSRARRDSIVVPLRCLYL